MTKSRKRRDPMDLMIEDAFQPGRFIGWNEGFSFVSDLSRLEREIAKLVASEPGRAVALYETFLAACNAKAEEVDDSDGEFGTFAGNLYCSWIAARQAADADRSETARLLLEWMDDDSYGFCNDLELSAVKVLDRTGLEAFESEVRARFDEECAAISERKRPAVPNPNYARDRWCGMLKAVYSQQRNVAKYIELTIQTGLTQADCEAVAAMFQARRKPNDALAWVERGLAIEKPNTIGRGVSYKLGEMRRALLVKLDPAQRRSIPRGPSFRRSPASSLMRNSFAMFQKRSARRGIGKRWMPRSKATWIRSSNYGSGRRRSSVSPSDWNAPATPSWRV